MRARVLLFVCFFSAACRGTGFNPVQGDAESTEADAIRADGPVDAGSTPEAGADAGTTVDAPGPSDGAVPEDAAPIPCTSNAACRAPQPLCAPGSRVCVQCVTAADCTAGTQACIANRCVTAEPCVSSRSCNGLVCSETRSVCVECNGPLDCSGGQVCEAGSCNAAPPACRSDRECSSRGQVCHPTRLVCTECGRDTDCGAGQYCTEAGACVPQVCTPDARSCDDEGHARVCDARGSRSTSTACAAGDVCATDRCVPRICTPGTVRCADGTSFETCNRLGLAWEARTSCASGLICANGVCTACDADGDGDDDGLSDTVEASLGTERCNRDTDGDTYTDLVENLAGSDPRSASSRPEGVQVTLPYDAAGTSTTTRNITVTAGPRAADVFFLLDATGSLDATVASLRSSVSTLVSDIRTAVGTGADVRFGAASFRDFGAGDSASTAYALRVHTALTADALTLSSGLAGVVAGGGGDTAEALVPALHALVSGYGTSVYAGTATRMSTATDCGGNASAVGWGCFVADRQPIVVAYSDAGWHNAPGDTSNFYSTSAAGAPLYPELVRAMRAINARYIGVEVGAANAHRTPSVRLATDTDSLDSNGQPAVYTGTPAATVDAVSRAVGAFMAAGRPNYGTRVAADPLATGLPSGSSTATFVRSVTTGTGVPGAPAGFASSDAATFYAVASGTVLTFTVSLVNTIVPSGASDRAWNVSVFFTTNGATAGRQRFWIVVPAA